MHVITAASEHVNIGALDDPQRIAEVLVAAAGGGGVVQLAQWWTGRRKTRAEASQIVSSAVESVVSSAVALLKPHADEIARIRDQHIHDMRELRDQHATAMERIANEHATAMERMARRVDETTDELKTMRGENQRLRDELAVVRAKQH